MATIEYSVIRSARRTVSLRITADGKVQVLAPNSYPDDRIRELVTSKQQWILKHLQNRKPAAPSFTDAEIRALAGRAVKEIPARVSHFAPLVGVTYGRITIRNQKTRWGSCSAKGNLNFNCLLMLAPEYVIDYVVIHELCHRKQMNHSDRFWAEVARICPNYKTARQWLKQNGPPLIARLPKG